VELVCAADVVITRPAGVDVMDPALRAAAIAALKPALALTLGFDATDGLPGGSDVTGGARIWADDDALASALEAELKAHTGRPAQTPPATDLPGALPGSAATDLDGADLADAADADAAAYPYARVELVPRVVS
jgi:hypothetical protein